MRRGLAVLPLVLLLAACAGDPPARGHDHPPEGRDGEHLGGRGVFISPMGEPFRGPGGRATLIGAWFAAADADHDGRLTAAEFTADAARFFRTLDVNGDGQIDPDELRRYETDVAPEIRVGDAAAGARRAAAGNSSGHGGRSGGGHGGGHHGGTGSDSSSATTPHQSLGVEGAARFGLLDLPEPVAAADSDFNRSVTAREFAAAAAARFDLLDGDGDGYLTLAKLVRR